MLTSREFESHCEYEGHPDHGHICHAYDLTMQEIVDIHIALDKQEPAKLIKERTSVGDYRCPACGAAFILDAGKTNYCGNCGQALDWSDEEWLIKLS